MFVRRLTMAALAGVWLGCTLIGSGTPDVLQTFTAAKAAYVASFDNATRYVTYCQAQPPTERCDRFTVKLAEVDDEAIHDIALGELLVRGVTTPEIACDEVADPGCTERARIAQIEALARALQELALQLGTAR